MEQVEFKVSQDIQALIPKTIDANFAEISNWLTEVLEPYQNLAVTEETLASAKEIKAKINKVTRTIDDYRKTVKKQYMQPYTDFEEKCKKLTNMCLETSVKIDTQVKEITDKRKAEKIAELKAFFDMEAKSVKDYCTWEQCYNEKWGNFTYKVEDAQKEITDFAFETHQDVETIKELHSEFGISLLNEYTKTHDLRAVLSMESALKARKTAENERKATEVSEHTATDETPAEANSEAHTSTIRPKKIYRLRFEVELDMEQANALKDFFSEYNIKYRKI